MKPTYTRKNEAADLEKEDIMRGIKKEIDLAAEKGRVVPHLMTLFEGQKCEELRTREVHVKSTLYKSAPFTMERTEQRQSHKISVSVILRYPITSTTKHIKISINM